MTFLSQEDHAKAVRGVDEHRLRSCGREGFITSVRVVDEMGKEVPRDNKTPGQIIVKSEANMVGYLNRPDLTAETLRDGWMWTGDVATWDADRYVFIVDRAKDMIISGSAGVRSHRHPGPGVGRGGQGRRCSQARPGGHGKGDHRRRTHPPGQLPEAALG